MIKIFYRLYRKIKLYTLKIKDPSMTLYYRYQGVKIGEKCSLIGTNISFSSEQYLVRLGDNVRVSFDVCFVTHDGGTFVLRRKDPNVCIYGPIVVGNNVFIGARTIIMPNINIGSNVIIGAGSIVTKDIPDNSVYAGVPAKYICSIDEYNIKNKDKFSYILNVDKKSKEELLKKVTM